MKTNIISAKTGGLLVLLALGFATIANAAPSLFERANASYKSGDFKDAAEKYAQLIRNNKKSPEIYYNLGNAQFRLNQKGQALLSYERARKAIPRDPDLLWNISVLKSTLLDRLDRPEEILPLYWARKMGAMVSMAEAALILSALLVLLLTVCALSFLWPRQTIAFKGLEGIALVLVVVAAVFFGFKMWMEKEPQLVVIEKEVFARFGPSGKETKAFLLHEGASGRLTDEVKDWVHITLDTKQSGWIPKKSAEIV